MPAVSLRDRIVTVLRAHLPAGWRLIPNQQTPKEISAVTVVLKYLDMEPLAEAPRSHVGSGVVVSILSPVVDDVKAENALDEDVLELVHALQTAASWIRWDNAKKIRDAKTERLGWDVTITAITNHQTKE